MKLRSIFPALSLAVAGLLGSPAFADDDGAPDVGDTVAGKPAGIPPVQADASEHVDPAFQATLSTLEGRPLPAIALLGGKQLQTDPAFVDQCQQGIELIFRRDYAGARARFGQLAARSPGTGVGPVGDLLVWQALMLENFDFRFEGQYQTALRQSRTELELAISMPGNAAWEHFLLAGVLGIDSIHMMRKEEWGKALNRGYEAMKVVARVKEFAPEFVDVQIGDGLFNYWITVVARTTKAIPDLGDKRELGISQMKAVEAKSIFLRPAATLALTYTWIEEGRMKDALVSAQRNQQRYPDNVINNLVLGRVYMYNRMYPESEATYKKVLSTDPKNQRVHYYLGRLHLRTQRHDDALAAFSRYLGFPDLGAYDRATALYYKGTILQRKQDWAGAQAAYGESWKVGKLDKAKKRLDELPAAKAKAAG